MAKRVALPRLIAGLTVALALFMTVKVQAVTLSIVATAACDETGTGFVITYTASVNGNGQVSNPSVDISFDGNVVDNGAFVAPGFSFGDTLDAPAGSVAGDIVLVELDVIGTWSNGTLPGDAMNHAETTVELPPSCVTPGVGRFTGGGHQTNIETEDGDVRVTRGLTIHCDLLLSNNLQINWGGNHFHMLEHLSAACSDDPDIDQTPPVAPLDTLIGVGTGRYNGELGYTIEFTLVDAGEPGKDDMMAILIYETANPLNVVLNVPLQNLTGGNLQAHYDQPHGSNFNK